VKKLVNDLVLNDYTLSLIGTRLFVVFRMFKIGSGRNSS